MISYWSLHERAIRHPTHSQSGPATIGAFAVVDQLVCATI
jgi:hypothetical protein